MKQPTRKKATTVANDCLDFSLGLESEILLRSFVRFKTLSNAKFQSGSSHFLVLLFSVRFLVLI